MPGTILRLPGIVNSLWTQNTSRPYDCADSQSGTDYVTVGLREPISSGVRDLHETLFLPEEKDALRDPHEISGYFVRFHRPNGERLTAMRRATQFKGVWKKDLILSTSDGVDVIDGDVFKLDRDFDLLIADDTVHIYRPVGFEVLGEVQEYIRDAAAQNVKEIAAAMPELRCENIEAVARKGGREARLVASVRRQNLAVDWLRVEKMCERMGIEIGRKDGQVVVEDGSILRFLELLDRRRYGDQLAVDQRDMYRATGRRKVARGG